uniref:Uncharacterized protein n=1 Tax=Alexandrium catenella TaxID=2925 RepID=A0A7S1L7A0_ALECA
MWLQGWFCSRLGLEMGQCTPGGYTRSDAHWITLGTDGLKDSDIAWVHGGPQYREALEGNFHWLLISDTDDALAVSQLNRVADRVQAGGASVHAQLFLPTCEQAAQAIADLAVAAAGDGRQAALLFRGDILKLEAGWHGLALNDVVNAMDPELGHCRLVLASCGAGVWAFGGKKPWGPHRASHATWRHVELFCASQPIQCAFTSTVPELYINWLLGNDRALDTMARVTQFPLSAVLAVEARAVV